MSALAVDIIIVAHNSGALLAEAVASAVSQTRPGKVWVMDAESTDDSMDAVRATGVNVESVPNRGFSASNNRGIETSRSPFVLLLNPDAVLCPGSLATLATTAQNHPQAGIVGALILNADNSVQAGSFGRFPSLGEALRLRLWRMVQRLRGNLSFSPKAPAHTVPVDWVSGAAMLVRREAITDSGPMDEGFFLYFEDTEWCHRMRDHGWEVLLEPRARVVHHRGGSNTSKTAVALAYRASFYRYCDLYGLSGLKWCAKVGLLLRRSLGGSP
jgi:N-acetylglucosaminyl-diphospho-decaprenol L-rhamnosyltransferase